MAICLSVLALGELIRDSGLALAVARAVPLSRKQKSNLFWINLGLGGVMATATFAVAPLLSTIFKLPILTPLMHWLALCLVFSGYSTQFRGELNRRLQFIRLTIVDTVPVVIGLGAAIAWAAIDPSVWALAAQQIATAASGALLATLFTRWFPGLPNRESVREFMNFGAGLLGAQLLAYAARNADNYLLGWAWGSTQLGYYSRAYQLLMAPMNQLLAPLTRVAVPVLSGTPGLGAFNRRLLAAQLAAGAPIAAGYAMCFGLAGPLVDWLLGPQWIAAVPIFQALCVGGVFKALNQATYWSFVATSRTKNLFRSYLVTQPLVVATIACGLPWGAVGVAWGHSIGYALAWAISTLWSARTTALDGRAVFAQAATILALFAVPFGVIGWVIGDVTSTAIEHLLWSLAGFGAWFAIVGLLVPSGRKSIRTAVHVARLGLRGGRYA
ncbi:lipopolysaccharide biosynthesis protein [Microbacterium sp. LMI12-1-1.1]